MKKNIIVGQSGGSTAVINASLYGVIAKRLAHTDQIGTVYGMVHGIEGFLSGTYMNLGRELTAEDLMTTLPAMAVPPSMWPAQSERLFWIPVYICSNPLPSSN